MQGSEKNNKTPLFIAFYLPQFHPIPENDKWWGKGFTEWTNVTKAVNLFPGHYQPHLPSDLGFYDLRVKDVLNEQKILAKSYGIDAFCYHYYWFSGKRLLEKPLDLMINDNNIDMPFCLCWANENWTRKWDAAEKQILISQKDLPGDSLKFIMDLEPYLRDPRYLRIDGALLLIVYQPQALQDPKKSTQIWRDYCEKNGIGPLHLCAALTHGNENYSEFGFDSGVEFPPHNNQTADINFRINFNQPHKGHVYDFLDFAPSFLNRRYSEEKIFKTVFPSWDNTARLSDRAILFINTTPKNYEWWLNETVNKTSKLENGRPLVFINAWNEWAEGCHLEPDRKYGHKFLESTLKVKNGESQVSELENELNIQENDALELYRKRNFSHDIKDVIFYHLNLKKHLFKNKIRKYPRIKNFLKKIIQVGR